MQEIELMDFPLHAPDGSPNGKCGLPVWLFGGEVNRVLLHQVVVAYMANKRQGDAATRNRALVRGGGTKPWRQKGTGRARSGSNRSPVWKGGGTIFGPTPRSYRQKITKKMKRIALISAFSIRARERSVVVYEVPEFEKPKTRTMHEAFCTMGFDGARTLMLTHGRKSQVALSSRNLPWLTVKPYQEVNCCDVLMAKRIVIDREIFEAEMKVGETDGITQDH